MFCCCGYKIEKIKNQDNSIIFKMEEGIGLELYVATSSFSDTQQYLDSELILATIKGHKIERDIRVVPLENLEDLYVESYIPRAEFIPKDFFDRINDPGQETKLPFLVRIYHDETGIVLGHSGLKNIADVLDDLYELQVTTYDTKTGNTSTYYPNQQH